MSIYQSPDDEYLNLPDEYPDEPEDRDEQTARLSDVCHCRHYNRCNLYFDFIGKVC